MAKELIELFLDRDGDLRAGTVRGLTASIEFVGLPRNIELEEHELQSGYYHKICKKAPPNANSFIRGQATSTSVKGLYYLPIVYLKAETS